MGPGHGNQEPTASNGSARMRCSGPHRAVDPVSGHEDRTIHTQLDADRNLFQPRGGFDMADRSMQFHLIDRGEQLQ